MEHQIDYNYYILKNPEFINNINEIIMSNKIKIKQVIIPVRCYKQSADSRMLYNINPGGLWNSTNINEQLDFYNKIMANYILIMTKYDINTLFLDFDRMINDKKYLFDKIKHILDEKNITFEHFVNIYDEVSLTSKPR